MIGIDPGLNVGSIAVLGDPLRSKVLKFDQEKKLAPLPRVWTIAERFTNEIPWGDPGPVSIEEPFYSHGRSNPRHMGLVYTMYGILTYLLNQHGYRVVVVHNRTVKKLAGYKQGSKSTKRQMIEAYKRRVGSYPPSNTKYGRETLADSYFIALAGMGQK